MNPTTERAISLAARSFANQWMFLAPLLWRHRIARSIADKRSLRPLLSVALICLSGCAETEFTPEGAKIQMVTSPQEKAKCDQLKYIEVKEPIGMNRMENADRRASNEVAAAGGDSLFVISRWFDPVAGAAVFGTALRCH